MSTISFKLTRIAVSAVLAGGVAAALVLPGGSALAPVKPPPSDFWSAFSLAAASADEIYLDVQGFGGGDTTNNRHPNVVMATTVDSGVSNNGQPFSGSGTGTTRSVAQQLIVTKNIDGYTPQFNQTASAASHLPKVSLFMTKAGAEPFDFFEIVAEDVLIQREHIQFAVGKDALEVVKLAYSKITWTYRTVTNVGGFDTRSSCWDFKLNRDCSNNT